MSRHFSVVFWRTFAIIAVIVLSIALISLGLLAAHKKTLHASLPDLPVALPATMPSDVTLTKAEKIPHDLSPYYRYTYTGASRDIVIADQLSGWNFDPHQPCMYMIATKDTSGETPISPSISCTSAGKVKSHDGIDAEVFRVAKNGPVDNSALIPDFYIKFMSDRYAVKATTGAVTEQEVKTMAIDFRSYNFQDLKESLKQ